MTATTVTDTLQQILDRAWIAEAACEHLSVAQLAQLAEDLGQPANVPAETLRSLAWFPEGVQVHHDGGSGPATAICNTCSVQSECLVYALTRCEKFGIWGGLSERQRRKTRNNLAAAGVAVRLARCEWCHNEFHPRGSYARFCCTLHWKLQMRRNDAQRDHRAGRTRDPSAAARRAALDAERRRKQASA